MAQMGWGCDGIGPWWDVDVVGCGCDRMGLWALLMDGREWT